MLTERELDEQREAIQDDLLCVLDGLDDNVLDNVCQIVVNRFQILKEKAEYDD